MTARRVRVRALATLGALGAVIGGSAVLAPVSSAVPSAVPVGVPSAAPTAAPTDAVGVTVLDVTPTTPAYTVAASPVTFVLSLTNTTDRTLYSVTGKAEREAQITTEDRLHDLIANPRQDDPDSTSEMHKLVVGVPLAPHQSGTVRFVSSTSSQDGAADICLCNPGLYPVDFTIQASDAPDGVPTRVGFGQTFLPSFPTDPQPVQVRLQAWSGSSIRTIGNRSAFASFFLAT